MSEYPDHPLLRAVRQVVAAAGRGDAGAEPLPFASGTGSIRYGPDREGVCPRPTNGPAFRFTVRAEDPRADEDWILGLILGDDSLEGSTDDQVRLTWCLGSAHVQIAEMAAAYSLASLIGDRSSREPAPGASGFMRWLAGRLDDSRLGEPIELDGSLSLVVLGDLADGPLPYVVSPLGRGVHAVPPNAVARAYAEDSQAFLTQSVRAATIRPRGQATRWRDRQGRSCYVLHSDHRPAVTDVGLFRPLHPLVHR